MTGAEPLPTLDRPSTDDVNDAVFCVVDCETTGLDPESDELVELAAVAMCPSEVAPVAMFSTLVRPTRAIPPEVSAVHHLLERDLANAPNAEDAIELWDRFVVTHGCAVFAAHNAEFDRPFLMRAFPHGFFGVLPTLCTKRLAMHVLPQAPNWKNQTLRYYAGVDVDTFGIAPHRALSDALVTAGVLRKLLVMENCPGSVKELLALAASPVELRTMPFGRWRGTPIDEVDADYLTWALRTIADLGDDLRWSIERSLRRRKLIPSVGAVS